jgi:uncharacterized protein (TIGR02599 family)
MHSGLADERKRPQRAAAFTLVETLTACAVFMIILMLMLVMTSNLTRITSRGTASINAFQEARTAFETVQRMLSQAVLNSYWDYDSPTAPAHYLRASELHFVTGPSADLTNLSDTVGSAIFCQAPLAMTSGTALRTQTDLLNTLGFYVRFSESPDVPDFLSDQKEQTKAWRLWMVLEPTEELKVYSSYSGKPQAPSDLSWFQTQLTIPENNHVLANNVILFLVRAGYSDANGDWKESFVYNSRGASETNTSPQAPEIHQIPPMLHITLVTIDSATATKLLGQSGGQPYDLLPPDTFIDAAKYRDDIETLNQHFNSRPLGGIPLEYRIFETTVNVTSSKWSR